MTRVRATHVRITAAAVALLATACLARRPALGDLPAATNDRSIALFALRSTECDANVSVLHLFERATIRRGITLVGVVLLDGDSAAATVRSQLRAFDVDAPVLHVSLSTRDSLARLVADRGPTILVRSAAGVVTHALPAPQSSTELRELISTLDAIAAHPAANR